MKTNLTGWQAVAREIGDYECTMRYIGTGEYIEDMKRVTDDGVVGDWLPAEAAAKEILRLRQSKDAAYTERDRLVQALSKLFPSYLCRHPESDEMWDTDWRWIVVVELPTGQASWHIHDSERGWFDHLEVRENQWDGHSTEEKYARLAKLPVRDDGEILRLRERVKVLEGIAVPIGVMEFSVVRIATAGKWFAKGWVNGQIVRGPDASNMGDAVKLYCEALAAAERQQEA